MFVFGGTPPAEKPPDALCEAWIARMAAGDKEALAELYGRTKDAVYGFALSIVQNAHEAEDVLQDTFVSVYTSARNYKAMGKPMAWVFTIAKNLALMKLRAGQKTLARQGEEQSLLFAEEAQASSEDRLVLTAALSALSAEESRIVMLHAVAGFRHREIAEILDLPLSTVLSKYARAIKKLRLLMEEAGVHAK